MINSLVTFSAKYLYLLAVVVFIAYFIVIPKSKRIGFLLLTVSSLPVIFVVSRILGHFYFDPRPFVAGHFTPLIPHAPDNGFPSDHELLTSALAAIMFFHSKKISVILWLLALVVGWARVLAGVHHWMDIIGAILISALVTVVLETFLRKQKFIIYKY